MPLILEALNKLGGSAKASSVKDAVATKMAENGEEIPVGATKSGAPKFNNDLQWARFYLLNAGYLEPKTVSGHGIWKLTGLGWSTVMTTEQALAAYSGLKPAGAEVEAAPDLDSQLELPGTEDHKSQLRKILKEMTFTGFERLCRDIMTRTGVDGATATGKTCDGGIDGDGYMTVGPASLVKMKIAWQCKRYKDGTVGSQAIRDFRGSMDGKVLFGMIFTTSQFTAEAIKEAQRPGATRIELIDVERLKGVLSDNGIGVKTVVAVDEQFFAQYKKAADSAQMELKPLQS